MANPDFQTVMLPLLRAVDDDRDHQISEIVEQYVERIEKRIVLIDGAMLAGLMLDHGVGVATARTYAVPRVDLDYFEQP